MQVQVQKEATQKLHWADSRFEYLHAIVTIIVVVIVIVSSIIKNSNIKPKTLNPKP